MEINPHLRQGTYDVMMNGKFTFNDHPKFREILKKFEDAEVKEVVFNMAQVDFVDSAALGMLLLALDESEKHRKRLTLRSPAGQVKKMFDMARFGTLFHID